VFGRGEKTEKQPISLEIVSIGKTVSTHIKRRLMPNELKKPIKLKVNNQEMELSLTDLFLKKVSIPRKLLNKIRGIKHSFIAFVDEQKKKPFTVESVDVNSSSLFIVKESTSLGRALSEMFSQKIGGKQLLFIGIIVIVAVVIGFVLYGQIQTGGIKI